MGDSACVCQWYGAYVFKTHGIQVYAQIEIHMAAAIFTITPTVSMGRSALGDDSPKARAVAGVDTGVMKALVLAKLMANIRGRRSILAS